MPYKDPVKQAAAKALWWSKNPSYKSDWNAKKSAALDVANPERVQKRTHRERMKCDAEYAKAYRAKQREKATAKRVQKPKPVSIYPSPGWAERCLRLSSLVRQKVKRTPWDATADNIRRSIKLARTRRNARESIGITNPSTPGNWSEAVSRLRMRCRSSTIYQRDLYNLWRKQASRWARNFGIHQGDSCS